VRWRLTSGVAHRTAVAGTGTATASRYPAPMVCSLAASGRALVLAALVALLLVLPFTASPAQATETPTGSVAEPVTSVEILPLRGGFIDPPVAAQIREVIELAEREGSDLVVLQYTSTGGVSVDLDDLLATIEESPVPVAVLIGPLGTGAEAVGAAGLLWLAADVRAIAVDASVGPLDPADLTDADGSYPTARRTEALLAAAGADPALADRLLSEAVPAEDLVAEGVVTLTAQGIEPLLVELDGVTVGDAQLSLRADEVEVRFHSLGLVRRLLHAATTGPFIYLLLVVGIGMLLFEVFQPGFGVAGLAGLITAAIGAFGLTVLPVTWWAVALVVLGLLLYAVDTAIAGFGPVTLAATVAFVVGSANFYAADPLDLPWWLIAGTTAAALGFFVFVMTSVLRAQAGPEGVTVDDLIGRPGIVRSVLNPEGHVYIDGALWRARWTGETKRAKVGTPVQVHGVDGAVVLVTPYTPSTPSASSAPTPSESSASTEGPALAASAEPETGAGDQER
jgi:membrane-bound serine protease (ClpP class)